MDILGPHSDSVASSPRSVQVINDDAKPVTASGRSDVPEMNVDQFCSSGDVSSTTNDMLSHAKALTRACFLTIVEL